MLRLKDVPTLAVCKIKDSMVGFDLDMTAGLEFLVAQEVQGRVAGALNPGYDVHQSVLYPDLTFQVKHSKAWLDLGRDARRRNRSAVFTFRGHAEHEADWYVLFGVKDDELYPFLIPLAAWRERGSIAGQYRILIISAARYSKRTKALKQNRLWECSVSDWPEGLHRRLRQRQELLFDRIV